ncbi:ATP-dependent Clp protease proteolytic subunit [Neomegalonema sp.]|uniref:ATP-dependent Clp protease proteolytic subunit n=1 Tax=Neomegalonema sp. TaxID=2039713 RepID=UPI00262CA23B|nr:ATP-dependent Clp protease proteolytic subunit [Neomegalonema sp.]MDD2867535.1 ATP-dependent Clp protease proteolytic subunit [Neomegalonema sp.]
MAEDEKKSEEPAAAKAAAELLFKSRNVLITGQIDDKLARGVVAQLLALAEDNDKPINLFVSSPGGHVESGDMIHDVIKFIKPEVRAIGSGWVASAGALIFVAAEKKNRFCLPNTRFLLHQPSGGVGGQVSDIYIQAQQMLYMQERLEKVFAEATGQTVERIRKDTQRDFWLTTQEALDYGLVGSVIRSSDELPKKS